MELSNHATKVALRVLLALDASRKPDDVDVAELRHFAPLLANETLDFLVREVTQQALLRGSYHSYGDSPGRNAGRFIHPTSTAPGRVCPDARAGSEARVEDRLQVDFGFFEVHLVVVSENPVPR
jgi:hypothetical protein